VIEKLPRKAARNDSAQWPQRESMKIKAVVEGVAAAAVSAAAFYVSFRWPAINLALKIRRKWPDAPFDGLIVLYAMVAVMGISIAVGIVAYRMVYRHAVGTTPRSKHSDLS